jgi:hypothetical protein
MTHVQSCARKNGLTDETIRILLRREIDNAPIYTTANGNGNLAPNSSETPRTFLENVVNDTAPKVKGKRLKVLSTIQSVTETRDAILDKAQAIFGDHSQVADEEFDSLPPSQVFGPSKFTSLSAARLLEPSTWNSTVVSPNDRATSPGDENSDLIGILFPQVFGPSMLRESYRQRETSDTVPTPGIFQSPLRVRNIDMMTPSKADNAQERVLPPLTPFAELITSSVRDRCHPDTSNENSVEILSDTQSRLPCAPDNTSEGNYGSFEVSETAHLVYEPCRNNNGFSQLLAPKDIQSHSKTRFLPNHDEAMEQPGGSENADATAGKCWNPNIEQLAKRTEKRRSNKVGDEWESRVRDKIVSDDALYLRILRYEVGTPQSYELPANIIVIVSGDSPLNLKSFSRS